MSFMPLDRSEVRTRDLMVDGQAYDQFYDPYTLATRQMWADIEGYQGLGEYAHNNVNDLNVQVPRL